MPLYIYVASLEKKTHYFVYIKEHIYLKENPYKTIYLNRFCHIAKKIWSFWQHGVIYVWVKKDLHKQLKIKWNVVI